MRRLIKNILIMTGVITMAIIWLLNRNNNYDEKYSTYSLEQINDGSWKKGDITFNSIVLKDSDYE